MSLVEFGFVFSQQNRTVLSPKVAFQCIYLHCFVKKNCSVDKALVSPHHHHQLVLSPLPLFSSPNPSIQFPSQFQSQPFFLHIFQLSLLAHPVPVPDCLSQSTPFPGPTMVPSAFKSYGFLLHAPGCQEEGERVTEHRRARTLAHPSPEQMLQGKIWVNPVALARAHSVALRRWHVQSGHTLEL